MLMQLMHEGKTIVEFITHVTLTLALLPGVGYGVWLMAGRPGEKRS